MSSNKFISSNIVSSKSKIHNDYILPKHQNDLNSDQRFNDSIINKQGQIKKIKVRNENPSQDFASVIFKKERAMEILQQQLDQERENYERLRYRVDYILDKEKQPIKKTNQRPLTTSASNFNIRESNFKKQEDSILRYEQYKVAKNKNYHQFDDEYLSKYRAYDYKISKKYNEQLNNNNKTEFIQQNSLESKNYNNPYLQQQYSTLSFGKQHQSYLRQRDLYDEEFNQSYTDKYSKYRNGSYQNDSISIKSEQKKVIDSSIQLYELQREKYESEIERVRRQVKILENELQEKNQETIQKQIQHNTELSNLQQILTSVERNNRSFEIREQETQVLIKQLRMKEDKMESLKQFYNNQFLNEQSQFNSTKRNWQKIYCDLQEDINILKHELNKYNISLINEQVYDKKQSDVQYINLIQRYN